MKIAINIAFMISPQFISRVTLRRDIVESFDAYPFSLPTVRTFDYLDMHPKVTYVIGENGSGKSTLLEAIAVSMGFNAEGEQCDHRLTASLLHFFVISLFFSQIN